jgi:hypothetical protein
MKLYHGTSEKAARVALKEGILPRGLQGTNSTWDNCPSHPDCVYLTTAYAAYFAMNATSGNERWGIIEIDTDQLSPPRGGSVLIPDEDFLEQVTRGSKSLTDWGLPAEGMKLRTKWFRDHLLSFAHLWEESIKHLGNCALFGQVPPEAITRVAFYDPSSNPGMTMLAADPMISLMNYRICGPKYRALVQWLMGDEVKVSDIDPFAEEVAGRDIPPGMEDFFEGHQARLQQLRESLSMREGLEVVHGR